MRGSLDVAAAYRKEEVKVDAMLQFDVIGHHKPGIDFIGITGDGNVNPIEANFLRILTDEYLIYRRRDKTCGFVRFYTMSFYFGYFNFCWCHYL